MHALALLLAISATLAVASLSTSKKLKKLGKAPPSCTAVFKGKESKYSFLFVEEWGETFLSVATKDQSVIRLTPAALDVFLQLGMTPDRIFGGFADDPDIPKSKTARCQGTIAAYLGLGYLYSTNDGGARATINNQLFPLDRKRLSSLPTRLDRKPRGGNQDKLKEPPKALKAAVSSLEKQSGDVFDLSALENGEDCAKGLLELVERVTSADSHNGLKSQRDTVCEAVRIFNIEPTQQYDFRLTIDSGGNVSMSLTVTSLRRPTLQSSSQSFEIPSDSSKKKGRSAKTCFDRLKEHLFALMDDTKRPLQSKLMNLLKLRVEGELARANDDSKATVFVMKGDTQVGTIMEDYVAVEMKRSVGPLARIPIRGDPEKTDVVLCEVMHRGDPSAEGNKHPGALELQLKRDFTIHKIHRLWTKSSMDDEYPERLKWKLRRFFEPSVLTVKKGSKVNDVHLCRIAIYDHLRAVLKYSNAVRGSNYHLDSRGNDLKDITHWPDEEGPRIEFRLVDGSKMAEALLELERAAKEHPDMPCRATWDSSRRRYYMELDREADRSVFGLRMITDGETDMYPLVKTPYEEAKNRCLQQPQGSQPRINDREICIFSIACYLWDTLADMPSPYAGVEKTTKASFAAILSVVENSAKLSLEDRAGFGSIDLGVVRSDVVRTVLPWMHAQGLTRMQENPDGGLLLRDLEPICQAAWVSATGSTEGEMRELALSVFTDNRIILSERSTTLAQRRQRVGSEE
ncbi:hypothetical protein FOZ61_003133 [Perkinsus olseni]|uniref:Protein kinase domain-containing protein n=1 Tax=Perkinsus olseni TaxID=32597 RepID=A0A7J6LQE3_PEROL|nr:hypothetical protein FOZ61_003133 [Perkinsus olseni]